MGRRRNAKQLKLAIQDFGFMVALVVTFASVQFGVIQPATKTFY